MEAANSLEGVAAEILPLDTEAQALTAATKYCISEGIKSKKRPLRGAQGVAANMLHNREEFPIIAISGMEVENLGALYEQVETLEAKKHPYPRRLSDKQYLEAEREMRANIMAHLKEARARLSGGPR